MRNEVEKLVVHKTHHSNYPDPIAFAKGESVVTGRRDHEYPGWIWVTVGDGSQGWAPEQYLQIEGGNTAAIAVRCYTARELNTSIGEELIFHYALNDWAWVENSNGDYGWVPIGTTGVA